VSALTGKLLLEGLADPGNERTSASAFTKLEGKAGSSGRVKHAWPAFGWLLLVRCYPSEEKFVKFRLSDDLTYTYTVNP
jgi:hypothetical protein